MAGTNADSFDSDDKEQKCLRLLKNKSDDIERYDHVQFLIRETSANNKSDNEASNSKDEAGKEPPDDTDFLCDGKNKLKLWTFGRIFSKVIFHSFLAAPLISPATFCKVFPFHLIFDRQMKIVQAGKSVSRVIPR